MQDFSVDDAGKNSADKDEAVIAPCEIFRPERQTVPVVFASPHSGRHYPDCFIRASRLNAHELRQSEDAFVDQLFERAVAYGAVFLKANFPRVYVDANRKPYELDPAMFTAPLPDHVVTRSVKIDAGLGTVPRIVTDGQEIYAQALEFEEVNARLQSTYIPYHAALKKLVSETCARLGGCLLVDCHSMPSPAKQDKNSVDVVLGDRFGMSAGSAVADFVENGLINAGFSVVRNYPYAGGFTTRHYGQPQNGIHALQIELNRALYMDEKKIVPHSGMANTARKIEQLIEKICKIEPARLTGGDITGKSASPKKAAE